ncbi:MAG: hypothetical protein H0W58_07340 [Acidobacteria bacterium]|jgi:hypothetical protein|nr:hypothetical protein [Acidobacteriota bacterium]
MSKAESADLILKLYETRRESVMREARNWMSGFTPESAEDLMKTMLNEQASTYFRMVTSYWDMAASFVNYGAIDEEMFNDANGEHIFIFSKIEPFLEEIRQTTDNPNYLGNLEKLVMKMPNAKEMLAKRREMMKRWTEARKEAAATTQV